MNNIDLDGLRAKAEAAMPGPWTDFPITEIDETGTYDLAHVLGEENETTVDGVALGLLPENAAYIAAANPSTILALLDLIAERDATIAAARKVLENRKGMRASDRDKAHNILAASDSSARGNA